jgi:hypothetical protein
MKQVPGVWTAAVALLLTIANMAVAEGPSSQFFKTCPGCRVEGAGQKLVFLVDRAINKAAVRKRMLKELRTTMSQLSKPHRAAVIAFGQSGLTHPIGKGYHKPPFEKDRLERQLGLSRKPLTADDEGNWIGALEAGIERDPHLIVILTDGFAKPAGHRAGMAALLDESESEPVINVVEFRNQGSVLANARMRHGHASDSLAPFARRTGGRWKLEVVGDRAQPGDTSIERVIPVLQGTSDKRNYVGRLVTVRGQYQRTKPPMIRGIEVGRSATFDLAGRRVQATGILEKQTITQKDIERQRERFDGQPFAHRGPGTYYLLRAVHSGRKAPVIPASHSDAATQPKDGDK